MVVFGLVKDLASIDAWSHKVGQMFSMLFFLHISH